MEFWVMPKVRADILDEGPRLKLGRESDLAKKMVEEIELGYFLRAYRDAVGQELSVCDSKESPDFVCNRPDGSLVGIELTKVVRDPESRFADEVFFHREAMNPIAAMLGVYYRIAAKELKRQRPNWSFRDRTILVVQIMECPLARFSDELEPFPDPHGFAEIWLAEYSEREAYGNIELFGLHPADRWGYHPAVRGKPYG
jgi:hypothetical protein